MQSTVAAAVQAAAWSGHDTRLVVAAVLGIVVVVVTVSWAKLNPFIALLLGSAVLGLVAGLSVQDIVASFSIGLGDADGTAGGAGKTFADVGILVALGAVLGRFLADSGGASEIVDRIVAKVPGRGLPWALAGAAALVGLPLFFEIGLVLIVPIVLLVAKRTGRPVLALGIPALAGLSVLHGFVPPHPGPLVAIAQLNADLGRTLGFGLLLAIPTVIIAGPLLAPLVSRFGPQDASHLPTSGGDLGGAEEGTRRPSLAATLAVVLLPVVLMLARAVAEIVSSKGNAVHDLLFALGTPLVALLLGAIAAILLLGLGVGMDRHRIGSTIDASLPPIASTLLIIAAGGGFKQVLVDAKVGELVGQQAAALSLSPLILGWLVAVLIRVATGSATVATITAAGIVAPLAGDLSANHLALLALAIGAGSLFFSHVNDVGFWLVKQFFGLTVGQTLKSWSVMETVISVVGLLGVLLLSTVA
ncbi:GntT/GntP/DsdX family permease [Kineococcus rubinsiae]|uniref:GntT/GntP/DsdX family permease n=1 Tax=Kineococcus rubinsiae TaxID=2609562 RepID=UPI00142FFB34|nr:gluconate:H+ symporter [Kineococcus rubinsiae]NIZ92250.1 gluconate transporter [Kineococcus rubinsiae]